MAVDAQERAALAEAVRDAASAGPREFLDDHGRPERDGRLWKVLTEQMGLGALLVPEAQGGAGAGVTELAVVVENLARTLAVVPGLSSIGIAGSLLRLVGTGPAMELLSQLGEDGRTATVCWSDPASTTPGPSAGARREQGNEKISVSGTFEFVLDGMHADVLLVPVVLGGDVAVVAVDADAPGLTRTAAVGLDLTRGMATVEFDGAPASLLGVGVPLGAAADLALVLIAAEQVGIAQHCHEAAVAWAKDRVQFDRPIGQFQAIKHQLVDLLMAVELGRSSLDVAVVAADAYLDERSEVTARDLSVAASMAQARCGDAAMFVADASLHILGGIGFTWEHDAHLYLRRAKVLEVLFGTPAEHRSRFAGFLLQAAVR
ncbi:acyl-CoA/acyl-ACP dehydrogenase [Rhodococcus opacus]|uniref:Acyl-CoA dehydrogenase family protein n=1 Tax=Rhodococcus opacus TaxID=37919 RepID=A0AAX3YR69_RHOOP|nr:acyl-CoA dehydrogenase family protein [Rhodococcus opacus]MCZ4588746.1 acyl-CoA/acyl-ACP dehydrogenase [Rhodococcus opacus]WLF51786.1 acyl-CoA dehydrogenase family protein [Rhodococcus opacus]WLF52417.1 acyl-CoA dehydrogenase family protein [Rhodococcus opacus]